MEQKEKFIAVGNMPEGIEPDGNFWCFETWINKATSWIGGTNSACYDAKGRRCRTGADFMKARDEDAFPVYYWHGLGGQSASQQRKSIANAKRALKARYPWRN